MPDIYISRESEKLGKLLKTLQDKGLNVEAKSQISRNTLEFDLPSREFDWIFFSSPYAVEAFFARVSSTTAKLAALGSGTAKVLKAFGEVSFIGDGSDTRSIGLTFLEVVGEARVLFPSPEKGLRAVQSLFPTTQYDELICYQTLPRPTPVRSADAFVFSSPSNVHAFAEVNTFPNSSHYIAFGPSTAKALAQYGVIAGEIIQSYEDDVLVQAIFSKFAS